MFSKQKALSVLFKKRMRLFLISLFIVLTVFVLVSESLFNITDGYNIAFKYTGILFGFMIISSTLTSVSDDNITFFKINGINTFDTSIYFNTRIIFVFMLSVFAIYMLSLVNFVGSNVSHFLVEFGLYKSIINGIIVILAYQIIKEVIVRLIVMNKISLKEKILYKLMVLLLIASIVIGLRFTYDNSIYISVFFIGVIMMYYYMSLLILKKEGY